MLLEFLNILFHMPTIEPMKYDKVSIPLCLVSISTEGVEVFTESLRTQ